MMRLDWRRADRAADVTGRRRRERLLNNVHDGSPVRRGRGNYVIMVTSGRKRERERAVIAQLRELRATAASLRRHQLTCSAALCSHLSLSPPTFRQEKRSQTVGRTSSSCTGGPS